MKNQRTLITSILLLAIVSFIPCLWLPITGEEGVYATGAYEALQHHQWLHPTLFGTTDWRPPLYQWLNLGVFFLEGQHSMLLAIRTTTLFATLISTLSVMWLSMTLRPNRDLALLTGACYLSGDVLLRRGWIAYADPTFAALVFLAITCLWIALEKKKTNLFFATGVALACAFLSKVITAYVFYGVFLLMLGVFHPNRKLIFSPASLISHLAAGLVYLSWSLLFLPAHGSGLIIDVTRHFHEFNLLQYLGKISLFPILVFVQLLPISFFALRAATQKPALTVNDKIALSTIALNLLPYWFSTHAGASRYILPMVPLMVLWSCHFVNAHAKPNWQKKLIFSLGLILVVKFAYVEIYLPNTLKKQHGDFAEIARDVKNRVGHNELIVTDSDYLGFAVATELDRLYYPTKAITLIQPQQKPYYVIETTRSGGELIADYPFGRHHLYLSRLG